MPERPNDRPSGTISLIPDTAHPPTDPFVAERLVDAVDPKSQVVTEFKPAPDRPASYPAGLPHLPGRAVWTTESPNGMVGTGARWLCTDPDAVVEELQQALLEAGWDAISPPDLEDVPVRLSFAQNGLLRLIVVGGGNESLVVQLLEVPEDILSGGPA